MIVHEFRLGRWGCRDVACYVWKMGKMGKMGEMGKMREMRKMREMGEMRKLTQNSTLPVPCSLFPVLRQMTIQTVNFNCSQPLN
jgi:hypothetical protein